MKFYDVQLDGFDGLECNENNADGMWATRDDAEQAAKERDEFERKCKELCFAYGQSLIELAQVKRDAVKMAELVKKYTYYTDQDWVEAQAIIERYEGGMGNG